MSVRRDLFRVAGFALLLAGLPWLLANDYYLSVLTLCALNAMVALGLSLLLGLAGQISLGHAAFYGIAAYGSAVATTTHGWPIPVGLVLGVVLAAVVAWLIGIPWAEAQAAGALLGTKIVLNEFLAFMDMAALPPEALSEHSRLILAYAMCSFANLGSLGILIAGLGTLCPERRGEITGLGMRALLAGAVASLMTGAVVGVISQL